MKNIIAALTFISSCLFATVSSADLPESYSGDFACWVQNNTVLLVEGNNFSNTHAADLDKGDVIAFSYSAKRQPSGGYYQKVISREPSAAKINMLLLLGKYSFPAGLGEQDRFYVSGGLGDEAISLRRLRKNQWTGTIVLTSPYSKEVSTLVVGVKCKSYNRVGVN